MLYILSLLFFCFSIVCSVDSDPEKSPLEIAEIVGLVVTHIATEKKKIDTINPFQQKEDVSLKEILELRRVNSGFNQGIVGYFFPNTLKCNNFVLFNNMTLHCKIANIVSMCQVINPVNLLDEKKDNENFELFEYFSSNQYRQHLNSYSMDFLDMIDDEKQIENLVIKDTSKTRYLFLQNDTIGLCKEAKKNFLKEKRNYTFSPCFVLNNEGYSDVSNSVRDILGGSFINTFPKAKIRIPDFIIDNYDDDSCIFIYNNGSKEEIVINNNATKKTNFFSFYFIFDYRKKQSRNFDVIENTKKLFHEFLQKVETNDELNFFLSNDFCIAKNILDIHLINDSLKEYNQLENVRNALQNNVNPNFHVRSVFDEEYGDFFEYENSLTQKCIETLKQQKNSLSERDIQYIKDVVCYILKKTKNSAKKEILSDFLADIVRACPQS